MHRQSISVIRQKSAVDQPRTSKASLQTTHEVHYAAYSLAFGHCGGDFNTVTPSRVTKSSRCLAKILSQSCSRYWYCSSKPTASRSCCSVQVAVGWAVTLQ